MSITKTLAIAALTSVTALGYSSAAYALDCDGPNVPLPFTPDSAVQAVPTLDAPEISTFVEEGESAEGCWDCGKRPSVQFEVIGGIPADTGYEFATDATDGCIPMADGGVVMPQFGDVFTCEPAGVLDGLEYTVRVRAVHRSGAVSAWVDVVVAHPAEGCSAGASAGASNLAGLLMALVLLQLRRRAAARPN